MYTIELWDGPLFLNGKRHMAVCDHSARRIIVSRTDQDSEQERLDALAQAVRLEMNQNLRETSDDAAPSPSPTRE